MLLLIMTDTLDYGVADGSTPIAYPVGILGSGRYESDDKGLCPYVREGFRAWLS